MDIVDRLHLVGSAPGDAMLPFGQVVLQRIPECSISETAASIEKLAEIDAHVLLARHLAPLLADARRHIDYAVDQLGRRQLPAELAIRAGRG